MRHEPQSSQAETKYCAVCGRLISNHVRNFEDRKYCSKSCKSTRLDEIDAAIEQEFIKLAMQDGSVECGHVQGIMHDRLTQTSQLTLPEKDADDMTQEDKTRAGNIEAAFRERVRRAARRVVVNGSEDGQRFICWSNGKITEPSFAKGEWAVKHVKS